MLLQAKALGIDVGKISEAITGGSGIMSNDQRIQVAIAASGIYGASAQSLQQASGQCASTCLYNLTTSTIISVSIA